MTAQKPQTENALARRALILKQITVRDYVDVLRGVAFIDKFTLCDRDGYWICYRNNHCNGD